MPDDARKLLWKADELQAQERATTQRLNPNSHLLRIGLSRLAGLQRAQISQHLPGRLVPTVPILSRALVITVSRAADTSGFTREGALGA